MDGIFVGLRDAETRVNLSSVFISIVYARSIYDPTTEVVPSSTSELSAVFSTFNDVAGAPDPRNPAAQDFDSGLYLIERTGMDDAEEGFVYIYESAPTNRPVAVEATLRPTITSTTSYDYVDFPDWTGMLLGLIHWPKNSGIFLFFRDDGGSSFGKYLSICGPAQDETGLRSAVQVDVTTFDWSTDTWTYRILWDDTPSHRRILVEVVSSDGSVETLLADIDATDVPTFRGSFTLGGQGASSGNAGLVVGNDGHSAGDRMDITSLRLFAFGRDALVGGTRISGSEVSIESSSSTFLHGDSMGWTEVGTGTRTDDSDAGTITLTRDEGLDGEVFTLSRTEPDLARKEWMLLLTATMDNSTHPGPYNSGVGVDVDDGTDVFSLRFLDDFDSSFKVGMLVDQSMSTGFEGYNSIDADWPNDDMQIILTGSTSKNLQMMFYTDDEAPATTGAYATSSASSGSTELRVGFCDSDYSYGGTLTITSAWLLPNVQSYESSLLSLPDAQGWSVASSAVGDASSGRLSLPMNTIGAYYLAYFGSEGYTEETGATAFFKAQVTAWTDSSGAVSPNGPIGPIAAILLPDAETEAVQVYLYKSSSGETFVCLPHSVSDFDEVSRQTDAGQSISATIDPSIAHVYLLEVCPRSHVRLYLDYAKTPSIDIDWSVLADVTIDLPTHLPEVDGASNPVVGAFGSLNENYGAAVQFAFARISVGTGYDISASLTLTDDDLTNHVYGGQATVFLDFSDED